MTYSTRSKWLVALCAPFALLLLLYAAVSWIFSSMILIGHRDASVIQQIQTKEQSPNPNTQRFELTSDDGYRYSVWYQSRTEQAQCAVIFVHGWGSSRVGIDLYQQALQATACDFITFDMRSHGLHPAPFSTGGVLESRDVLAIHQHLIAHFGFETQNIAWFGVSLGGSTVLQAAAQGINPALVITDSAFRDWDSAIFERGVKMYGAWVGAFRPGIALTIRARAGIWYQKADAVASAQAIQSPVLLIHSATDSETAPSQSEAIYDALVPATRELQLTQWGSDHAKDAERQPEAYRSMIEAFIERFSPHFLKKDE